MPDQLDHYQRGGGVETDQRWTCWAQPPTALFVSENVKAEPDTSVHIRPVYSLAIGGMLSTFLPGILKGLSVENFYWLKSCPFPH